MNDGNGTTLQKALASLEPNYKILAYFKFEHLPEQLRVISKPFAELAYLMAKSLAPSAEVSAGLRKLLEAKDCFVRAAL